MFLSSYLIWFQHLILVIQVSCNGPTHLSYTISHYFLAAAVCLGCARASATASWLGLWVPVHQGPLPNEPLHLAQGWGFPWWLQLKVKCVSFASLAQFGAFSLCFSFMWKALSELAVSREEGRCLAAQWSIIMSLKCYLLHFYLVSKITFDDESLLELSLPSEPMINFYESDFKKWSR